MEKFQIIQEEVALSLRAQALEDAADDPDAGEFHWRRVPGTAALAATNLIAGLIVFDIDAFVDVLVLDYLGRAGGPVFWGAFFLVAGLFLGASCIRRKWWLLNVGSTVSLFAWTATCLAIVAAWFTGTAGLSPVGLALAFWMVAGQGSMLITPLVARGRGLD